MSRTLSTHARRLALSIGLVAVLPFVFGVSTAHAAEVAPQFWMRPVLFLSQSSDGSVDVDCAVTPIGNDGSFSCGSEITGRIVGVTNTAGVIIGHRVYMSRRVSSTVVETYTGAIAYDDDDYGLWMTGEYSVTTQVRRCTIGQTQCLTYTVFSGPKPFTGQSFYIGG
jgi:hypothetical protein